MKIRSITDVITNSSSEVFVFKLDDPLYQEAKKIESFDEFPDYDALKKAILNDNYYEWMYDEVDPKPYVDIFAQYVLPEEKRTETSWEKYKDLYEPLLGHAFLAIDRDSDECDKIRNLIYKDRIKREIIPIIETLEEGKEYVVKCYGSYDYFTWEGKPNVTVRVGDKTFEINIVHLLDNSDINTLHENQINN